MKNLFVHILSVLLILQSTTFARDNESRYFQSLAKNISGMELVIIKEDNKYYLYKIEKGEYKNISPEKKEVLDFDVRKNSTLNEIMALTSDNILYLSRDEGKNWNILSTDEPLKSVGFSSSNIQGKTLSGKLVLFDFDEKNTSNLIQEEELSHDIVDIEYSLNSNKKYALKQDGSFVLQEDPSKSIDKGTTKFILDNQEFTNIENFDLVILNNNGIDEIFLRENKPDSLSRNVPSSSKVFKVEDDSIVEIPELNGVHIRKNKHRLRLQRLLKRGPCLGRGRGRAAQLPTRHRLRS